MMEQELFSSVQLDCKCKHLTAHYLCLSDSDGSERHPFLSRIQSNDGVYPDPRFGTNCRPKITNQC